MHLIPCPWCGARHETEFVHAGETKKPRPRDASTVPDTEWRDYLMARENPRGPVRGTWWHVRGCGLFFAIERDTRSHAFTPAKAEGGS